MKRSKIIRILITVVFSLLLVASAVQNVWYYFFYVKADSYLQSTDELYTIESGILYNNREFREGEDLNIEYDLSNEEYPELIKKYGIDKTAGEGSEFERAMRLMDEYSPRLSHKSNYGNEIPMNAMDLLSYSLDNVTHGINCRSKAQILNEMCLALGIYSRKLWILPYSGYDTECHVVNEVWDSSLNKWVMLDITNNEYWVDENGTPLSVMEIRQKGAEQEFCTPVSPGEDLSDLKSVKKKNIGDFVYIMKNMAYTSYCLDQTVGESNPKYTLYPVSIEPENDHVISLASIERAPF